MTVKVRFVKDYVVYNDKEYKGIDGLGKLCRELVDLGYGSESLEAYRGEMLCLTVPKIEDRANKSMQENDDGLRFTKHRPFIVLTPKRKDA